MLRPRRSLKGLINYLQRPRRGGFINMTYKLRSFCQTIISGRKWEKVLLFITLMGYCIYTMGIFLLRDIVYILLSYIPLG